jgi:serine/threonine-protein kinase
LLGRAVKQSLQSSAGGALNNPQQSKPLPGSDESRLPMSADSADDRGRSPVAPSDTFHMITGQAATAEDSKSGSGSSTIDSMVGRLVVEQGLATEAEVQAAITKKKQAAESEDPNQKSLAQILVDDDIVTERQLRRLRDLAEEERKGQAIAGYKVLDKLGAGAMATVFKARQLSLDRLVAIKILPRKFSANAQFIERFYAEGRAAAQLNHPNIVQAYDVGKSGEFHYFVMEYVEGATVYDAISAAKRFKEAEAIDIAIATAEALEHAHKKGLVHRDVKPKNIMLSSQGIVKLADLGLARAIDDKEAAMAEAGKAYGTPYYISPEQIRGEVNVGPQADIYSLGATVYHMLTGNVPFNGKNPAEVMQKHLKAPLVPPDHVNPKLSAGISEVVERMMAKSRKDRYKNCEELLVDLRAVRRGEAPPHAHREAPAEALAEVLQSQAAQMSRIATDSSREPSPFSHPKVKSLIGLLIATMCFAGIMTVAALISWFGR